MVKISVAMTTYNGARHLREQLESIAAQRTLPLELQVGDDGSCDDTLTILRDFANNAPFPVTVHRNERNLGFGENFIQTALRCKGEWIAFCDQDDVWMPEKLERCAAAIRTAAPDLMLVAHGAIIFGQSYGSGQLMDHFPQAALYPRMTLPPGWMCQGFRQIFRKTLIEKIPPAPRHMTWRPGYEDAHDVWIALVASAIGSIMLIGDTLVRYRRHESNTTPKVGTFPGILDRTLAAMRNNAPSYLRDSEAASEMSDIMTMLSGRVADHAIAASLQAAASVFRSYASDLRTRAAIYQEKRLSGRIAGARRLIASRRYSRGPWAFGPRAFIKDLTGVILPTRSY